MKGTFISENLRRHHEIVECNAKLSFYPDGKHKLVIASKPIFKENGWELPDKEKLPKPQNLSNETRNDSVRRAMQTVFDISRLNRFTHFITWTLDKEKIDRYDPGEVSKKLKFFLNNKVKRNNLKYLIIPEYHKDGAIHIHGLISGDLEYVDSGKQTNGGQRIYNMPQWTLGFSTAIELDDNVGAISRYITKYISKDFKKIFGNFYYAGGHGLQRKPPTQLYDINYFDVNQKEYTKYGVGYKYVELGDYTDDAAANTAEILRKLECLNYA